MFLEGFRVILNGKFCSFLIRILIQKDNTDNKDFKNEFIHKKQRGRKYGNLSERVSGKQSF